MPRVCAREGCGKRLVRKDGTPDYHRHFCSSECKNADKREGMQEKPGRQKLRETTFRKDVECRPDLRVENRD